MAKRRRRRGMKGARAKFGAAAKAANATCHRDTNSVAAYKGCMRTQMRSELKKRGFKTRR